MCINFEKNRLKIDDFIKSEKNHMFSLTSHSAKNVTSYVNYKSGDIDLDRDPIICENRRFRKLKI